MGTEALWVPLVLGAASAGATAYNSRRVANKQDATAAAGIRKQAENQRQANQRLQQTLEFAQQSKPDEVRDKARDQYLNILQSRAGQARASLAPRGVSSAYDQEARASSKASEDLASNFAGLMARMDAPALQRQQEQFSYGNLGMDFDRIRGNVGGDEFLNRLQMAGIRRNPWLDAGAAVAGGVASGYGGGRPTKKSPRGGG